MGTTLPPCWGHPDAAAALTAEGGRRREGTTVPWLLGRQLLPGLQDSRRNERRRLATGRPSFLLAVAAWGGAGAREGAELRTRADCFLRHTG